MKTTMSNNLIKAFICLAPFILPACSKELNTAPTQSIDVNTALQTSDDVKAALTGTYSDFGSADFYGGRIFMEADLLANTDELNWTGTYQGLTQIYNKTIPVDNNFVRDAWLAGYRAINDANNVLSAIKAVDAKDSASVAGQAKFIRGASYFELVKRFAKAWNDGDPSSNLGVPLVLTATTLITEQSKVKRSTVAEVYQQVIKDLSEAEASSNNPAAAAAILARVYLQQANFTSALQAADMAISKSGAKLTSAYAEAFGAANTSEDIFAVQVTPTSGTQGFNEFYSSAQRGDIQINDALLNLFDSADDRLSLFYEDNGSIYTGKFEELYGNVHTIRLAEMLLVRAEANVRLGTKESAAPLDDINAIRKRANLAPYSDTELTLAAILNERKLELVLEGCKLDDVKRLQQPVANLPWNSPKLIFPIPKREILANTNLTQNEGY